MHISETSSVGLNSSTNTPVVNAPSVPAAVGDEIRFEVVGALLTALCARDRSTAEHSWRVAKLCLEASVGRFSYAARLQLGVAALLHDVGKIGIPDWVLKKPAALNEYETTVMRMHDSIGLETLRAARMDEAVIEIVKNHATSMGQNLDFKDHSDGARVLRIADAFDALVSDNVYRLGKSELQALDEIQLAAGQQFDAEWVQVVRETIDRNGWDRGFAKPYDASRHLVTQLLDSLWPLSIARDKGSWDETRSLVEAIRDQTDHRPLFALARDLADLSSADAAESDGLFEAFWLGCWNEQAAFLI